jgi:hypothetical protein
MTPGGRHGRLLLSPNPAGKPARMFGASTTEQNDGYFDLVAPDATDAFHERGA